MELPDLTQLQELATMQHEWFQAMLGAGFTEDQALKLIAYNMAANNTGGGDTNGGRDAGS